MNDVEDECFEAVDRRSESEYLTSKSHTGPYSVSFLYFGQHFVPAMRLGLVDFLIDRAQIFREILEETAELGGGGVTFSRSGVCARKLMRETRSCEEAEDDVMSTIIGYI